MFLPAMLKKYKILRNQNEISSSIVFEEIKKPEMKEEKMVARIKKFLNFVGLSLKGKESFLNEMRR